MKNEKYIHYYKSPVGILEIITSGKYLTNLNFVNEIKSKNEINETMNEVILQLDKYFKGELTKFNLKLDLCGTTFQKNVWNALLNIKYGHTVTYKNIACEINNEKSVRAVGNANKNNKISIIVPCHRVIGSNNSLTGYAGGLDKKLWLLNHEKAHNPKNIHY